MTTGLEQENSEDRIIEFPLLSIVKDNSLTCVCCKKEKDKSLFKIRRTSKTGYQRNCKKCEHDKRKLRYALSKKRNNRPDTSLKRIVCTKCKEQKDVFYFGANKATKNGYSCFCRVCEGKIKKNRPKYYEEQKLAYKKNYPKRRIVLLARKYKISEDDCLNLYLTYSVCAICGKPPEKRVLNIDHDHKNGKVRGLLCFHCNVGIGRFRDDVELLQRAIDYLKKHQE